MLVNKGTLDEEFVVMGMYSFVGTDDKEYVTMYRADKKGYKAKYTVNKNHLKASLLG
jgi:Insect cuticle protein